MFVEERTFEGVMKRIGASMLIFVAAFNLLCGGIQMLQPLFVDVLFPNSAVVYAITEVLFALAYCASFILPVFFFYLISKKQVTEPMPLALTLPKKQPILKILSILFIGISVVLIMSYLNSFIVPAFDSGNGSLFETDLERPYKTVLLFLTSAVAPAFAEEFMFRGMIYANLRPYGRGVAILISALLFGLMHQNAGQLLYTTAAGIVLAVVYELTGSFWCCVLLHFFNNFYAILEQIWFQQFSVEKASLLCSIVQIGIFFVGLIFAALWGLQMNKKSVASARERSFFGETEETRAQTSFISGRVILRGFFNPVMIAFLVLAVFQMIAIYFM